MIAEFITLSCLLFTGIPLICTAVKALIKSLKSIATETGNHEAVVLAAYLFVVTGLAALMTVGSEALKQSSQKTEQVTPVKGAK